LLSKQEKIVVGYETQELMGQLRRPLYTDQSKAAHTPHLLDACARSDQVPIEAATPAQECVLHWSGQELILHHTSFDRWRRPLAGFYSPSEDAKINYLGISSADNMTEMYLMLDE
jgi:hypothetical protein